MYRVRSFLLQEIEQGCVLQNGTATVIITNEELLGFLKSIEQKGIIELEEDCFIEYFQENYESVIDFLINTNILKKVKKPRLDFDKLFLVTNDNEFSKLFEYSTTGFGEEVSIYTTQDYQTILKAPPANGLCIVFLNPFNLDEYISICNELMQTDLILRTGFFYNHSLYLSNLYKKEWYNPCPKCVFYALESHLRATISQNGLNFQTVMDLIYAKNSNFKVFTNLEHLDLITFINLLLKDIKFKEENFGINNIYELDLGTYRVTEDSPYHWELCDCYE